MKLHLVSLGCARNLVDSELMLGRLKKAGWSRTEEPAEADTIVVNTCSFIESAVHESIDTILELAQFKHDGAGKRLIVTGCLPERYREEIVQALPEVDIFLGTGAFDQIVKAVGKSKERSVCILPDPESISWQPEDGARVLSTPHMAYLKIAEGCSRHCTYCIIPKLRGKQKSRPLPDIVAEARHLIRAGVKELVLVAQDTTSYGSDGQPPLDLGYLVEKISDISYEHLSPGLRQEPPDGPPAADCRGNCEFGPVWIRVLYGHPESIQDSFIKTVATRANICSYFDIPIQHVSGPVLKRMGRRYNRNDLYRLFDEIRSHVPDAALRTTLIVGFPGETDKDFARLLRFIKDVRFDHLGVFIYSDSEDLPSHRLPDHISTAVARERYDELMACQVGISAANNRRYLGRILTVLVEEALEDGLWAGRTYFQAPEVDGLTYINTPKMPHDLKIGCFTRVKITDALEYDLVGETT
ncbi:MAG: MiaB/RimO family radical SAM methylthiotransferase [Desulfobacterales bacterium]|nr:MAG: MiaB/RimO family radical SAM methylthiotransferase [Desulfobacterales bacterium]